MTGPERNKEIVRDFMLAVDRLDRETAMSLLHEDHRLDFAETDGLDRDAHWQIALDHHDAFDEMVHRPDIQVAEGDRVMTQGTITAVHARPLGDIEPTGAAISIRFMNNARIVDGQICGMSSLVDDVSLRRQLGLQARTL